jgi:hypothetical protein
MIMRTTIDLDAPILRELKRLQKAEGKSLGRLVSDLLAPAIANHRSSRRAQPPFHWIAREMGARIDVGDKEAVYAVLDTGKAGRRR